MRSPRSASFSDRRTAAHRELESSRQSVEPRGISNGVERRTCFHCQFIRLHFTTSIIGPASTATDTDDRTLTISVRDVMKAPVGLRGLVRREVTV